MYAFQFVFIDATNDAIILITFMLYFCLFNQNSIENSPFRTPEARCIMGHQQRANTVAALMPADLKIFRTGCVIFIYAVFGIVVHCGCGICFWFGQAN
jgi:hypothetical protein